MADPACYELARHFLGTLVDKRLCDELAQHIQDAIEDWIKSARDERSRRLRIAHERH